MHALDDIARLYNDLYARVLVRRHGVFALGCAIALCSIVGAGLSIASIEPTQKIDVADVPVLPCRQQTWPYISDACLQADQGAAGTPARQVRQISIDRDSPRTVYLYPEAPKPTLSKAKRSSGPTSKADRRADRRPARRAAPQRAPVASGYHTYGYRSR